MAYVPPHKRHSKEANPTTPAPTQFPFQPPPGHRNKKWRIKCMWQTTGVYREVCYSKDSIARRLVIPSSDSDDQDGELSCSVRLKEFTGNKYMILVRGDDHPNKEVNENVKRIVKSPWVSITDKIQQDLLTSFQTAREEMCKDGPELILPRFEFEFGKMLFQRSSFDSLETLGNANKSSAVENVLSPLGEKFIMEVPNSFCEAIPKTGLDFVIDKEHYYITVYDKSRPDKAIICKCNVTEGAGELQLHQIGRTKRRQMVVDISCLEKNLDLRLLVHSKRILASLTDDEKQSLNNLVNSAVINSKVEGRLRLSAGKKSVCGRYEVAGYIHSKCRVYKSSFTRLKIRQIDGFYQADYFDISPEVSLTIPELTSQLRDATMELNPLIDTVRDTLKFVWENFLCWEGSFT